MGVLFEYFLADSDEVAASVLSGGPRQAGLPFVDGRGIDPVVMMGHAEALLTGRTYDEVGAARGDLPPVALDDGGELLVLHLPGTLVAALADASSERLVQVAGPWSQTEEFWGHGDPHILAAFLDDLGDLCRQGRASGRHLYCWICV